MHFTDAQQNPPQISVMHNSSSNIYKLGDRDLLISLQASSKTLGLGLSENTRVWGMEFWSGYTHISLAETQSMYQNFSCSYSQQVCSDNMI